MNLKKAVRPSRPATGRVSSRSVKSLTLLLAAGVWLGAAVGARAGISTQEGITPSTAWPVPVTLATGDPGACTTGVGVTASTVVSQTITPTALMTLDNLYFSYSTTAASASGSFGIRIQTVTGGAAVQTYAQGANLLPSSSFTFSLAGTAGARKLLKFTFSGPDRVTLTAGTTDAVDITRSSSPVALYRRGADTYSGGNVYSNRSAVNYPNTRDLAMAVVATAGGSGPDLTGYTLSFADEFDALSISANSSTTTWTAHTPYGGDFGNAKFMNPVAGFPFTIANGALRITCKKVGTEWQSGLISSVNPSAAGFHQRMGYWEARMKFPAGSGVWPGFWLLGMGRLASPRTNAPEIDIVEYYCQPINQFSEVLHVWTPAGQDINYQWNHATGTELTTGFHTYSVLIKDDFITWYWDGVQKFQQPTPADVKTQDLWCMAEYALGGGWPIDEAAVNNSYTDIDYIRAYAPPAGGGGTLQTGTYKIVAKHSGKCLDGGGYSGGNVLQNSYTAATDQKWVVSDLGSGQYVFREVASACAMQVTAASTANNALIQIKSYGPYSHQMWMAQAASAGYYRLINVNSGKAIQVVGSSTADGANVEQYTIGTGANQEFSFLAP